MVGIRLRVHGSFLQRAFEVFHFGRVEAVSSVEHDGQVSLRMWTFKGLGVVRGGFGDFGSLMLSFWLPSRMTEASLPQNSNASDLGAPNPTSPPPQTSTLNSYPAPSSKPPAGPFHCDAHFSILASAIQVAPRVSYGV